MQRQSVTIGRVSSSTSDWFDTEGPTQNFDKLDSEHFPESGRRFAHFKLLIIIWNVFILCLVFLCPYHLGWMIGLMHHPLYASGFRRDIVTNATTWQASQLVTNVSYQRCSSREKPPIGLAKVQDSAKNVELQRASPKRMDGDPILACMMYTFHSNRQKAYDVVQTWARYCDHLFVFSDELFRFSSNIDPALNFTTIEVHAEPWWRLGWSYKWPENMWGKLWSMWTWVNKTVCHPPSKSEKQCVHFDFLLVNGDDTYVVMENLRSYLASTEIMESQRNGKPLYIGKEKECFDQEEIYGICRDRVLFADGCGYLVNRVAFDVMLRCDQKLIDIPTWCEDVMTSKCLGKFGVPLIDNKTVFFGTLSELGRGATLSAHAALFHYVEGITLFSLHSAIYGVQRSETSLRSCTSEAWEIFDFVATSWKGWFTLAFCVSTSIICAIGYKVADYQHLRTHSQ